MPLTSFRQHRAGGLVALALVAMLPAAAPAQTAQTQTAQPQTAPAQPQTTTPALTQPAPAAPAETAPATATEAPAPAPDATPAPATAPASATAPAETVAAPAAEAPAPAVAAGLADDPEDPAETPPAATAETAAGPATATATPSTEPAATDAAETGIPAQALPHDLSPMGMFMAADIVVKGVMIGLLLASVLTWTVFLVKAIELWLAFGRLSRGAATVDAASGLEDASAGLRGRRGIVARMVSAAQGEAARDPGRRDVNGVKERAASHLGDIVSQAGRRMGVGTGLLATIGSTAPFVGLFGTVWGIMNSFIGISESQTTNLAVVAPGIAEALLATALGLVAAIPAVVIYNLFARAITAYRHRLGAVSSAVQRHLSRDLGAVPIQRAA